jgi:hypothetical protein
MKLCVVEVDDRVNSPVYTRPSAGFPKSSALGLKPVAIPADTPLRLPRV